MIFWPRQSRPCRCRGRFYTLVYIRRLVVGSAAAVVRFACRRKQTYLRIIAPIYFHERKQTIDVGIESRSYGSGAARYPPFFSTAPEIRLGLHELFWCWRWATNHKLEICFIWLKIFTVLQPFKESSRYTSVMYRMPGTRMNVNHFLDRRTRKCFRSRTLGQHLPGTRRDKQVRYFSFVPLPIVVVHSIIVLPGIS